MGAGGLSQHLPEITNIAPYIRNTASPAPFGMENVSPLDVSTGLHRTQHKHEGLQINFFFLKQAVYVLQTYVN